MNDEGCPMNDASEVSIANSDASKCVPLRCRGASHGTKCTLSEPKAIFCTNCILSCTIVDKRGTTYDCCGVLMNNYKV